MNHCFSRTHIDELQPDVDDVSKKRKQKRAKDDGHDTHSLTKEHHRTYKRCLLLKKMLIVLEILTTS